MMKAFCKCMGLAVLAAAMFAACTMEELPVDESIIEEPVTGPTSIHVTVGAGIAADPATKSEVVMEDGARVLKFTAGDRLYVYGRIGSTQYFVAGFLSMVGSPSADGKKATFAGDITVYLLRSLTQFQIIDNYNFDDRDPLAGTTATLVHSSMEEEDYYIKPDKRIQFTVNNGVDVETMMTKYLTVTGEYNGGTKSYSLGSNEAIFNCILTGLAGSHTYDFFFGYNDAVFYETANGSFTTDENGIAQFAFPAEALTQQSWGLWVSDENGFDATIDLGDRVFENKIYNLRRNYGNAAFGKYIDLSQLTDSDFFDLDTHNYRVKDGDVLTGEFLADGDLYIEANAKVTLAGVTHHAADYRCGLICEGSADIILAEGTTNYFTAGSGGGLDGIVMNGKGDEKTYVTISGSGTLLVSGGAGCCGIGAASGNQNIIINGGIIEATGGAGAAGIGGSADYAFGDITINGGTVKATGGTEAAGIGSGTFANSMHPLTCGNITINGGTVDATGGAGAAGIGCGDAWAMRCGAITISNQVTSVTARRGESVQLGSSPQYPSCIGKPALSRTSPGDITFGSMLVFSYEFQGWYKSSTDYTAPSLPAGTYGGLKLEISNPDGDEHDEVWTLTPVSLTQ